MKPTDPDDTEDIADWSNARVQVLRWDPDAFTPTDTDSPESVTEDDWDWNLVVLTKGSDLVGLSEAERAEVLAAAQDEARAKKAKAKIISKARQNRTEVTGG